jgi:hypothetical protein
MGDVVLHPCLRRREGPDWEQEMMRMAEDMDAAERRIGSILEFLSTLPISHGSLRLAYVVRKLKEARTTLQRLSIDAEPSDEKLASLGRELRSVLWVLPSLNGELVPVRGVDGRAKPEGESRD